MKKISQDFNINEKVFVVELLEDKTEGANYKNIVIVSMSSSEGNAQLQFNTYDKTEDAKKQFDTISATLNQVEACLTKPIYEHQLSRTHNHYWVWD
jgi:hypothetical protein